MIAFEASLACALGSVSILICQIIWSRRLKKLNIRLDDEYSRLYTREIKEYRSPSLLSESPEYLTILREVERAASYLSNLIPLSLTRGRLVCRALDTRSGHAITLKTLMGESATRPRSLQGIYNEAFVLNILSGTRSPKLIAAVTTGFNRPCLMREFIDGVSLDRTLIANAHANHKPRYSEVKALLDSTASAVSEIHSFGVIHGDLKPANIVARWRQLDGQSLSIDPIGEVSLLDFESAAVLDSNGTSFPSSNRGTPYFMAPERYAGSSLGPQADVYSISALTSLLLTGRPHRYGAADEETIGSSRLRDALRKGSSVLIQDRFQTISDWRNEVIPAINEIISRDGDPLVDWPISLEHFAREIANQTATVDLNYEESVIFRPLIQLLAQMSIDGGERGSTESVRFSRELIEAVYRGRSSDLSERGRDELTHSTELLRRKLEKAVDIVDEDYLSKSDESE